MIVLLKPFSYYEWFAIATANNTTRAEKGFPPWTDLEINELWAALHG